MLLLRTCFCTRASSAVSRFAKTGFPSIHTQHIMSAKDIVEEAIANNDIAIFSKSWCSYSRKTKQFFTNNFSKSKTIVIELDQRNDGGDIQDYLLTKTGQSTVPNVFVAQQHIGGSSDTMAKQGRISTLLNAENVIP